MNKHQGAQWFSAREAVDQPVAPGVVRRGLAYGEDAMFVENRF